MRTKYGGLPEAEILPAEVTLISNSQPDAVNCSATRTANGAPTARPTTPTSMPSRSVVHISV